MIAAALCIAAASLGQAASIECRLSCAPREVAIGEPVLWELTVEHPASMRVELSDDDPLAGLEEVERLSWFVVAGPERQRLPGDGRGQTRFRWTVLSLEGGERSLPVLEVRGSSGGAARSDAPLLKVWTELAAGEDEPRELAPLVPVRAEAVLVRPAHLLVTALLLLAGWLLWRRRRRLRGRVSQERAVDARARLDEIALRLQREAKADPRALHDAAFELTGLLRRELEGQLAFSRPAATDLEWLALARSAARGSARASDGLLDDLEAWLRELEPLKYAGEAATAFRAEELARRARAMLERAAAERTSPRPVPELDAEEVAA